MHELNFVTEPTLAEAFEEVQRNFNDDLDTQMEEKLEEFLNGVLQVEADWQLGASRYQRSDLRLDYRAGYRSRSLITPRGTFQLRVPKARCTPLRFSVFERYQRLWREVEESLREIFLAGCSTRRTGEVLELLLGTRVSAQTVSRAVQQLTPLVEKFHRRRLEDGYRFLFLDGVTQKVRTGHRAVKKVALVAYGMTYSGHRELIDFQVAPSESRAGWFGFLNRLFHRGLIGDHLQGIISDGSTALAGALEEIYPHVPHQTCWTHELRNLAERVTKADQPRIVAGARRIYLAPNRKKALETFRRWRDRWIDVYPRAVRVLERHLETLLTFLDFPESLRKTLRTTNVIERSFREVRRRTRPMSSFANVKSYERITYAIFVYLNAKWERNPLPLFAHNS